MNVRPENLQKVRKLLKELEQLEKAQEILGNYDAEVYAYFRTEHNNNEKNTASVYIPLTGEIKASVEKYMRKRMEGIKEKLKEI